MSEGNCQLRFAGHRCDVGASQSPLFVVGLSGPTTNQMLGHISNAMPLSKDGRMAIFSGCAYSPLYLAELAPQVAHVWANVDLAANDALQQLLCRELAPVLVDISLQPGAQGCKIAADICS